VVGCVILHALFFSPLLCAAPAASHSCILPTALLPCTQGFNWEALSARRMDPPRRPIPSDMAKRRAELEESHKDTPVVAPMSTAEKAECDKIFKDF